VSYSLFLSVCTTTNLTLGTTFGGQATLVELDRENIRPFHYVLETHSEIIIEFLLSLVEKEKMDKGRISILYLYQKEDVTAVNQVKILDNGEIQNWPESYFTELFEIEDI